MEKEKNRTKLTDLPIECLSQILALTTPKDVIRTSLVSKAFASVSELDSIWEKFIPSDYEYFISLLSTLTDEQQIKTKKDLFLYLWKNPIIFNNNAQSIALDKFTAKKIFMLNTRKMDDTHGTIRYPNDWEPMPNSRSPENALLVAICWMKIKGKFQTKNPSPNTTYGVYFVYKEHCAIGCENTQVEVSINGIKIAMRLEDCLREGDYGWLEIEMGRYHVGDNNDSNEGKLVKISIHKVKEFYDHSWKSDFSVSCIELRPLG